MQFQTYLKDCECKSDGIILYNGKAVCRWCRNPYGKGGCINYENEHFESKQPKEDYEILSLIGQDGSVIYKSGYTYPECFQTLVNAKDVFKINSVQRNTDMEVFSLDEITNLGRIVKFEIYNNTMMYATFEGGLRSAHISNLEKVKQREPLFTTVDMKNMYEGDTHFYVGEDYMIWERITPAISPANKNYAKGAFGTIEAAKQYILENKPIQVSYKELECLLNTVPYNLKSFFQSKQ
jgi:hypothetical protein